MTTRAIEITGSPVLHSPAMPVTTFDHALVALVDEMFETMDTAPGVGLAGPQVGMPLRLFVYDYHPDEGEHRRGVIINPELWQSPLRIDPLDPATESEGCLSVPGERFPVRRADRVVIHGVDLANAPLTIEAEGWFARIFQHEFDHLNGILYVDRLVDPAARAAAKAIKKQGWGKPGFSWTPGVDDIDA